jgi:hypothetical protein
MPDDLPRLEGVNAVAGRHYQGRKWNVENANSATVK